MSTLEDYLAYAKAHPTLFVNPPEAGFTILLDENEIREAEAHKAQQLEAQGMPPEWAQVGIAYQDQYVLILRDAVRFPDGTLGTCTRWGGDENNGPGVSVLPLYQGYILLIRHFRHEMRTWRLEIPGGFGIPGLSSEESAQKELEEEIGAAISRLISLGQVQDASSNSNHIELFFAEVESYGDLEMQEGITELLPTSVSEFERMIRTNEITDVNAIVAYTRAKLQGLL